MPWYYAEGALQTGPVPDEEFTNLVRTGKVRADTLVWREGMANWQPYSAVSSTSGSAEPALPPGRDAAPLASVAALPSMDASGVASLPPVASEVVCHECGKLVAKDNAIQYGSVWVCATCKPVFVQKLKEGTAAQVAMGALRYAGFWIRVAAKMIDSLIMTIIVGLPFVLVIMGVGFGALNDPRVQLMIQAIFYLIYIGIITAYNTYFVGKFGATPGKMACSLKIVMAGGTPVSYGRAFGRSFAELLSGMTCNIGYLIAAFDEEKRSLHDHICATRVVYK